MKNLKKKELELIAEVLNSLVKNTDKTTGVKMNTIHFSRFFNKTHYIDFNEKKCCFKVYKKYINWKKPIKEKKIGTKELIKNNLSQSF